MKILVTGAPMSGKTSFIRNINNKEFKTSHKNQDKRYFISLQTITGIIECEFIECSYKNLDIHLIKQCNLVLILQENFTDIDNIISLNIIKLVKDAKIHFKLLASKSDNHTNEIKIIYDGSKIYIKNQTGIINRFTNIFGKNTQNEIACISSKNSKLKYLVIEFINQIQPKWY